MPSVLYRYASFTTNPLGGNPAGVWIGDALPDAGEMQRIAAGIGLPDTAFVAPAQGLERSIRYYSPETEVSFCGHATIATAVIFGKASGTGTYRFTTGVGVVPVAVRRHAWSPGRSPRLAGARPSSTRRSRPRVYAGNWHLVLAAATQDRLAALAGYLRDAKLVAVPLEV